MTKNKRFKAHIFDDGINERYHDGIIDNENDKNVIRNYQYISELLNGLNDENKQLKELIADKNKTQTETLKQLTQTQKELITIKNTIKDMYDNERTHLGHNVLAQLIEAIQ